MKLNSAEMVVPEEREVTEDDKRDCRLITLLLCNAKFLQGIQKSAKDKTDPAANIHILLQGLLGICEGDGDRLERDAITLARELGMNVAQHNVHPGSAVPQ
jgi:hypothetical protein